MEVSSFLFSFILHASLRVDFLSLFFFNNYWTRNLASRVCNIFLNCAFEDFKLRLKLKLLWYCYWCVESSSVHVYFTRTYFTTRTATSSRKVIKQSPSNGVVSCPRVRRVIRDEFKFQICRVKNYPRVSASEFT